MTTKHEAIFEAFHQLLDGAISAHVLRDEGLPVVCPSKGLVNIESPRPQEIGRQLGTGIREFQRVFELEVVVTALDQSERKAKLQFVFEELGVVLLPDALASVGVDYLDVGPPEDVDEVPMAGSENLRGAVVHVDIFYETNSNVMETAL